MEEIIVVDARMGRGKSTAAIRYMNQHKWTKRFLYITPYLDEVGRVCTSCEFDQAIDSDYKSKSTELKKMLHKGISIAATHALFMLMDEEALTLVRQQQYCLIVDESLNLISREYASKKDLDMILNVLTEEAEDGQLRWRDVQYEGRFSDYKQLADLGCLYHLDTALFRVLSPAMLEAFSEVHMLTYLFEGQYQKAYLDYHGLPYRVVGIGKDADGYYFSDAPDDPPPTDYGKLINLVEDSSKLNRIGDGQFSLAKNWYTRRGYKHPEMQELRKDLRRFFRQCDNDAANTRLWTCFLEHRAKLLAKDGRYNTSFLQLSCRATNEYRNKTQVAYLVNRYLDPNLVKFFAQRGITIDGDAFALAEMLQWIWRSAIRDGLPIDLYVPSRRMRELLLGWIDDVRQGRLPSAQRKAEASSEKPSRTRVGAVEGRRTCEAVSTTTYTTVTTLFQQNGSHGLTKASRGQQREVAEFGKREQQ
jgi:hypothetical protein